MIENKQETLLKENQEITVNIEKKLRHIKFLLFFLGLINNTPLVLFHGISKDLSKELD